MKFCQKKILTTALAVTLIGSQILITPMSSAYANTTTQSTRSTSSYPVPTRAIYLTSPTMKGNDVKYVQEGLKKLGYYTGSIDGSFGPACKTATTNFQKHYGLTADGSFGPATLTKFKSAIVNSGPANPSKYTAPTRAIYLTSPTMKGDDVKYIQAGLKKLGYYKDNIDGSFGPACQTATSNFQKAYGLAVDGSFGPATLAKFKSVLGLSSSTSTSSSKGIWPVPGNVRITSEFGPRMHPIYNEMRMHNGIDIAASTGTNIVAVADGTVKFAGWHNSLGNYIDIDHGNGKITRYAHCSSLLVSTNAKVTKGKVIAKVGSTGDSTGPHLHFGVKVNGQWDNPLNHVSK